jgi:sulfur carrier protein
MGLQVYPIMPNFAVGNQNKKDMAQIVVNDERQEVTLPLTLSELIKQNRIFQPEMVTVQINETFIEKEDYDKTQINDGDKIDFLYFMGGGCR